MATRKAICLVNGLFEEVNTPTDKLDFAGNTTTDLTEGTNLYFTTSRARASISVTDNGGDGALSYDSATGVISYTGPSASEVRAHFSVATGSGLTYNSGTGEFGTNAIPNSQLANSTVSVGTTIISLGAAATTIDGLTSLSSTTVNASSFHSPSSGANGSISIASGSIVFEGTNDDFETTLVATDATADQTITLPNLTGTVVLLNSLSVTETGTGGGGLSYDNTTGVFTFTKVSSSDIRTQISVTDNGGDGSLSYDNTTGVISYTGPSASEVRAHFSVATGSGLTYNSGTGEFGTSAIPNSQLANSSITIGSTGVALGGSATSFTGLTSVTSQTFTATSGFLVPDGTVATPGLRFASDLDTGIFRQGTNSFSLVTNGTRALSLTDSQRVVTGHTAGINLGTSGLPYVPRLQVIGNVTTDCDSALIGYSTNPQLHLGRSGSSSIGTNTAVTSGFTEGLIAFDGTDGTDWQTSSIIIGVAEGTISTGIVPGRLEFWTTDATGTFEERLTINSAGNFTFHDNPELRLNNAANTFHTALTTAGATANRTITFPDATGTVLLDTSTLPATFLDSNFRVQDNSDNTKQLAFECSGISTSTTRTMTVPNENGTISTQDFATAIAIALG